MSTKATESLLPQTAEAGASKQSVIHTNDTIVPVSVSRFGKHNVFYGFQATEAYQRNVHNKVAAYRAESNLLGMKIPAAILSLITAVAGLAAIALDLIRMAVATAFIFPAVSVYLNSRDGTKSENFGSWVDFSFVRQVEVDVQNGANAAKLMARVGQAESAYADAAYARVKHEQLPHDPILKAEKDLQAARKALINGVVNNTRDASQVVAQIREHADDLNKSITSKGRGAAFMPDSQRYVKYSLDADALKQLEAMVFEPVIGKYHGQLNADLRLKLKDAKIKNDDVDAFLSTVNGLPKFNETTGVEEKRSAEEGSQALEAGMKSSASQAALKVAAKEVEAVLGKDKKGQQTAYKAFVADKKKADEKRKGELDAILTSPPKAFIALLNEKVKCDIGEGFTKLAGKVVTDIDGLEIAEDATWDTIQEKVDAKIAELEQAIDTFEQNNPNAVRVVKLAQYSPEEFTKENLEAIDGFIGYAEACKLYFRLTRDTKLGYATKKKGMEKAAEELTAVKKSLAAHEDTCEQLVKGRVALINRFAPETKWSPAVQEFLGETTGGADDSSRTEAPPADSSREEAQPADADVAPEAAPAAAAGEMDFESLASGT